MRARTDTTQHQYTLELILYTQPREIIYDSMAVSARKVSQDIKRMLESTNVIVREGHIAEFLLSYGGIKI